MEGELKLSEIEFIAQDEPITILPTFQSDEMEFVSGTFGPFEPLVPVVVPLWLGVTLRKNKMCKISPPSWMSLGNLLYVPFSAQKI
jgi:GINS complex subunit 2